MKIVLDIEANGLEIVLVKRIHVVCIRDIDTDETQSFRDPQDFKRFVWESRPELVVFHNGYGYDLPVLRRVWGIPYSVGKEDTFGMRPTEFVDTFQLSSFLWPDRPGGHSLENLAKLAGGPLKQDYRGGFEEYSEDMEKYCISDTAASVSVYKYLLKEVEKKYGTDHSN